MEEIKPKTIKVNNLIFEKFIDKDEIKKSVKLLAKAINIKFEKKDPVFLAVLDGSFMFASDLLKRINVHSTVSFIKIKSYTGTQSTGSHKELIGLDQSLKGKNVIIIEDIIDTGHTMKYLLDELKKIEPESITITTLLVKRDA
ncbi:MAG: hypoxanthine phosphoribosyltransferase, partial [Bacteroidetes bacterium]|nr:hypoxanthine phosphoribosyltransferase [Bacteroidota bacterium]